MNVKSFEMLLSCNFEMKAQKELLDAELDFHKKLTTGEDTTDLKRRLGQLQVEVSTILSPVGHLLAPC